MTKLYEVRICLAGEVPMAQATKAGAIKVAKREADKRGAEVKVVELTYEGFGKEPRETDTQSFFPNIREVDTDIEPFPEGAVAVDWKDAPMTVAVEINRLLFERGLRLVAYTDGSDSIGFGIEALGK